mgnify:CR=1 FL=1
MKVCTTSERLKELIKERGLRQVDIVNAAKPFCEKYNVKLGKTDLSQYVSGKVEPGQEKLTILGLALNVSEAWLMGYDVPSSRDVQYQEKANQAVASSNRDGSEIMFALSRGGEKEITDEMFDEVKRFAAYIASLDK